MYTIETCSICQNNNLINHGTIKDHSITGLDFNLSWCGKCNTLITNPRPELQELNKFYQHSNYVSHSNKANNVINSIYKIARRFTIKWKRRLIEKQVNTGSLLDFGCGTGQFIDYMSAKKWETYGVDPLINKSHGQEKKIFNSIDELTKKDFNVITLWHVLEHVYDPLGTLQSLKKILSRNGLLYIAVPNTGSLDRRFYSKYWSAYDVPRHFYHFSQSSIRMLFKLTGLKLIHTIPMKLDAYYISLLSNKYKDGKYRFLKSINEAWIINRKAKVHNQYSSNMYIATHH